MGSFSWTIAAGKLNFLTVKLIGLTDFHCWKRVIFSDVCQDRCQDDLSSTHDKYVRGVSKMSCDLFFTKTCQAYLTKYGNDIG